jgi:hypothetical protein
MSAIEEATRAGIDLSLIDENLRLTPEQRALQHQAALNMVLELEAAFRASCLPTTEVIIAEAPKHEEAHAHGGGSGMGDMGM